MATAPSSWPRPPGVPSRGFWGFWAPFEGPGSPRRLLGKGSIRVPLTGSIRVRLKGSKRVPLKGSKRVPLKGSIRAGGFYGLGFGASFKGLRALGFWGSSEGTLRLLGFRV